MRIAVGFLTHNRRRLTRRSFLQLLRQPFEMGVVVDNASDDGTDQVVRELAAADGRFKLIFNQENRYPGAARNQMVEVLEGRADLIVFVDNDILLATGCFDGLARAFRAADKLGQISPLAAPEDFLLEEYAVGGQRLARTISNATSATTAVRTDLFRSGLRWRELRWRPAHSQEIGEDYFLSRDLVRRGYEFAWFARDNPSCCLDAGRTPEELRANLPYYLRTFADRGMLSRLSRQLPDRAGEVESYREREKVPEIHGSFSLLERIASTDTMSQAQRRRHRAEYLASLPEIQRLRSKAEPSAEELRSLRRLAARCRDYFDGLGEAHPLFGQRTLQATIFFNRLFRRSHAAEGDRV